MSETGLVPSVARRSFSPLRECPGTAETDANLAALRQRLAPSLSPPASRELQSLERESDPELRACGLLHLAGRLSQRGSEAEANEIYNLVSIQSTSPLALRSLAQERQAALQGTGGSIGARVEILLRRFGREVADPAALFAMGAAGAVFRVARFTALSRLAQSPASVLSRGPLASILASVSAFALEAPAFTLAHRLADLSLGRRREWNREILGREFASSFITLGAMRLIGSTPSFVRRGLGGGRAAASTTTPAFSASSLPLPGPPLTKGRELVTQAFALYSGILLGHGLEINFGLRPAQKFDELLLDSAAMFLQFQVAGRLSRRAFGERWTNWENRLDIGAASLIRAPSFQPAMALATAGGEAIPPTILQMSSTLPRGREGLRLVSEVPRTESAGTAEFPQERLRPLPRGGVMAKTSAGWLQFGVPMWTNKDAFEIFLGAGGFNLSREDIRQHLPTTYFFDLDYVAGHDGLLPADFMQYMYFINRGTETTLVAPDAGSARRLHEFLDLSYQGPRENQLSEQVRGEYPVGSVGLPRMGEEISRGFPAAEPEALRRIAHLNAAGEFLSGDVRVQKHSPLRYEIFEAGVSQGMIDLAEHPLPQPRAEILRSPELTRARRKVLSEGRPALWPIGTGHGFTPREETSGFLLWNRGKAIAIDPPSSTMDFMAQHRLPLSALDGILLTHGHTDHYGNAVPQLLQARPDLKVYTTPTIFRMLQRQYELAIGNTAESPAWNFIPLYPQSFSEVIGLSLRPEYSFHPVPAIGFEIYDRPNIRNGKLVLSFTGDSFADHVELWRHTQAPSGQEPLMSAARAAQVLRHGALLLASKNQNPPPVFLIEGGVPPIHINPLRTRELLDQAEALGVDTSRVRVYHIAGEMAAEARVPKWQAGVEGFFDLSGYFRGR